MTGKFITLEGSEGAGKSTNLDFIASWLAAKGIEVITTREPGGTELGEAIREILLDSQYKEMTSDAELLLMFAARVQHLQQKIQPALARGAWVISDRFVDASYAYQGAARGLGFDRVADLEAWSLQGFKPDLTLVFDLDPKIGMQRVGSRGNEIDRFEQEKIEFFTQVRQAYLLRAEQNPLSHKVLDAQLSLDKVQQQIAEQLELLCN